MYARVLLPLPLPEIYTYGVPVEFHDTIVVGLRVEVPFNKKLYSGIVTHLSNVKPVVKTRNIISLLDDGPIVGERQLEFWQWLSSYYCAHPGEVMNVALPAGLKLSSETKLMLNHGVAWQEADLNDQEYLVCEALSIQQELTIKVIQDILNKKSVYPIIKSLVHNRLVVVQEELITKYSKKKESFVRVIEPYDSVELALELTQRSQKQSNALLALYSLRQKMNEVPKKAIYDMAGVDSAVINAIAKKGIVEIYQREVSRLDILDVPVEKNIQPLTDQQTHALDQINAAFKLQKPVLLHGVTGSGKTRVFICLLYTSPSPRDLSTSRMPSSA